MLTFFREKAKIIGWIIVSFFLISVAVGGLFALRNFSSFKGQSNNQEALRDSIAQYGNTPISAERYRTFLEQINAQLRQTKAEIDPEIAEMLSYTAFNQALNYTVLLEGAKAQNVKVTSKEMEQAMDGIYRDYDLKDKKALKEMLKKLNYPYDAFVDSLEEELMTQKFAGGLRAGVRVSDKDVFNKFTKVEVQHILIALAKSPKEESAVQASVNRVVQALKQGMPFEEAAKKYSQDSQTSQKGGHIGWISYGQSALEFEQVAFAIEKGETSQPIRTAAGTHIIKVLNRQVNIPTGTDIQKEKPKVLEEKQNRVVQEYIQMTLAKAPLVIHNSILKAYHAKMTGDINGAVGAYQAQISANPSDPVPHYLLAKVYVAAKNSESAKNEFEKALLKAEVSPSTDFPSLHVAFGQFLGASQRETQLKEYEKALALSEIRATALKKIADTFTQIKEPSLAQKALAKLSQLKTPTSNQK